MAGIDSYTMACWHFDGDWADASGRGHTGTASGAAFTTAQSKFGGTSAYFDGGNDYVSVASSSDWDWAAGQDLTIDLWHYTTDATSQGLLDRRADTNNRWHLMLDNSDILTFGAMNAASYKVELNSNGGVAQNTWHHYAIVRSSGTWTMYIDGTAQSDTGVWDGSSAPMSSALTIGLVTEYSFYADGEIDELRFSKGIARWTSNFTPPSAAYSPAPEVSLRILRDYRATADARLGIDHSILRTTPDVRLRTVHDLTGPTALARVRAQRDLKNAATTRARTVHNLYAWANARARAMRDARLEHLWRIYSRDEAGAETYHGDIAGSAGTLALSGISLADGTHQIEARPQQWYWECRAPKTLRAVISGGGVASAVNLPAPDGLSAAYYSRGVVSSWSWPSCHGATTPDYFGVWYSDSSPVSTAGAPSAARAYSSGAVAYSTTSACGSAYVAVAAVSGTTRGPSAEVAMPAAPASLATPAWQHVTED